MKRVITALLSVAVIAGAVVLSPIASENVLALRADSSLIMTADGTGVCGTNGSITAAALAAEFDCDVTVLAPSGEEISGDAKVPSGSTVVNGDASLSVLISGDCNRDGSINISDALLILKKVAKWDVEIDEHAASVSGTETYGLSDAVTVLKYIANWNVELGCVKIVVDSTPLTAAGERSDVSMWFEHSTDKLYRSDVSGSGDTTYTIYSAKNEAEGAALYIANNSGETIDGVTVSATDFVNCYGDTIASETYTYFYHPVNDSLYMPDAMMPNGAYEASVKKDNSQGFFIKASVPEDAVAGLYRSTVSIYEGSTEIKRARVYLHVWNFALNDEDACETSFGISKYQVAVSHNVGGDTDKSNAMYKAYYDYFLENRINGVVLPYDILDESADEYLNDPRVRSFMVAGTGYGGEYDRSDEQIEAYYQKIKDNAEWMNKSYFYYVDEPIAEDKWATIKPYNDHIQSLFPGGMQVVPMECRKLYTFDFNVYKYFEDVQIWCPRMYAFTPEKYRDDPLAEVFLTAADTEKYGTYEENAAQHVENGGKSWWYFARMPFQPYTTYHAEDPGVLPRLSFWQQYQYNVTGVLYYSVTDYNGLNPFHNFKSQTGDGLVVWGNGVFCYPGYRYGIDGPIGSVRVEYLRDGIEDYMYLTMIERFDKNAADEYVNLISRDLLDYDADSDLMSEIRIRMGEYLESHING